jgi:hypothetical protein
MVDLTDAAIVPPPSAITTSQPGSFFADLEQFKVDMKEAGLEGAIEQLASVEVRKPRAVEYIRVHPGPEMTISVALHEYREGFTTEYYIVMPNMLSTMLDLRGAIFAQLYLAVTRSGTATLWPVKLPTGGASNSWLVSALRGAELAKKNWIRIFSDTGRSEYRIMQAVSEIKAPEFPDKRLSELLELAFKGRVIDSIDHPMCRKLRGEA